MISQNSFRKAWENRKLVGGALKAAHVRPDYHLYEDLFQEGSLADIEQTEAQTEQRVCERSTIWMKLTTLVKNPIGTTQSS